MLNLTLRAKESLKIGEDVHIYFEGGGAGEKIKLSIDAPKDKRIERVPVEKARAGA